LDEIILQKSAIILAGGFSRRFGSDKGLVLLRDKPLVRHVIDKIYPVVNEVLVVVSSENQKKTFKLVLKKDAKIIIDKDNSQSPLIGAMTGFEASNCEYSLLLPCDAPLVSTNIIQFLFDMSINRRAVIPRWPSGYIEPLQAVYHTKSALIAAKIALRQGNMNMRSMIDNLHGVRYISTMVIEQLEPGFVTFLNVNTPEDLRKAESFLN